LEVIDDTTFTTTIEMDSNNIVTSISNTFFDENLDTHTETIRYRSDPFKPEKRMKVSDSVLALVETDMSQMCDPVTTSEPEESLNSFNRGLAEAKNFLRRSVKPSTRSQYDRIYRIWKDFCAENNFSELEAGHEAVASCLSLVMLEGSLSKVSMLAAAIANEHRIHLKKSPTTHESISQLFRAFRLCPHKVRDPVLPLTSDIIRKIINYLYEAKHGHNALKASTVLWRTVWRLVIEYHTLGRWDDVIKLKRSDLQFEDEPSKHLQISFKNGKTDMYSEGGLRIVAADTSDPLFCPVRLTQHYLGFLGTGHVGFLIPACNPQGRPNQEKAPSYSTCLEDLRNLLETLGIEGRYGEHSGKRGGASQAAENGMSATTLKRLGGWKSDVVPQKYVDLTVRSRIEMSKMLQKKF